MNTHPTTRAHPTKSREFQNHHFDSTIWNDFKFRDDDIIIATYGKSGTTWTQQIVAQLLFQAQEGVNVAEMSPWMDLRVPPKHIKLEAVEAQTHRRFLKTHLPVDALVFNDRAKYLYIARDGRDVVWSLYNHHLNANALWYELINDTPDRAGPPIAPPINDINTYFHTWLHNDGSPWWPFWDHIRSWWTIRNLPNVMLLHYNELKADLPGQIQRIAEFLEIPIAQQILPKIIEHCSFDYMKQHAADAVPLGGICWDGGAPTFIHKGTNGRWRDTLPQSDIDTYESIALQQLGPDCAHWLASGNRND